MKSILLFIFSTLLSIATSFSQAEEKGAFGEDEPMEYKSFKERLYVGGNLSLNFGSITYIDVAPIVGYRVTEDFSVGVGGKYVFISYNNAIPASKTSIYGGSVFSRYLFLENFLAHAEFELLSVEVAQPFSNELKRQLIPIGLIGGGYKQSLGKNAYFQFMLLYDVIGDKNSPYGGTSPFGINSRLYLRGGVTIGL